MKLYPASCPLFLLCLGGTARVSMNVSSPCLLNSTSLAAPVYLFLTALDLLYTHPPISISIPISLSTSTNITISLALYRAYGTNQSLNQAHSIHPAWPTEICRRGGGRGEVRFERANAYTIRKKAKFESAHLPSLSIASSGR